MVFGEFIDLVLLAVGGGQILDDAQVQRQDVCAYAPTAMGAAFEEWYNTQITFAKKNNTTPLLDAIGYTQTVINLGDVKKDALGNYYFVMPGNVFSSNGAVFIQSLKDKDGAAWIRMNVGNSILRTYFVGHDEDSNKSKIIFSKKPTCALVANVLYQPDCEHEDRMLGVPDTVAMRAMQLCLTHFGIQSGRAVELAPDFAAKDALTNRPL